jgi:transposase
VKYSQKGWSQVKIAKNLKCSRCCVQYTLKRFVETGATNIVKKTGRNRITTERDDRKIERISLKNRKKSSSAVASDFNKDEIHKISSRTVRRRLNEVGLKGRRARKKPWLSADNIKTRLAWAKNHKNWTTNDWVGGLWSDETYIEVNSY